MKVVHSGIDTLDVAFQGALRPADVDTLQVAKDEASETRGTTLTKIGPEAVEVAVYGYGTKTGYSFIVDTGPDGETWTFNRNTNPQNWNIRVSIKARTLAALGYHEAKQQMLNRLVAFGCTVIKESISRADYAIDIQAVRSVSRATVNRISCWRDIAAPSGYVRQAQGRHGKARAALVQDLGDRSETSR